MDVLARTSIQIYISYVLGIRTTPSELVRLGYVAMQLFAGLGRLRWMVRMRACMLLDPCQEERRIFLWIYLVGWE